jgi:hypothetical protein
MDVVALWLGWVLVWACGAALVALVYARSELIAGEGALAFVVGFGWFLGQFLLTLLMRALSAMGAAFGVASIGGPLLLTTVLAAWLAVRRNRGNMAALVRDAPRRSFGMGLAGAQRAAWLALAAWLGIRLALLLLEVLRRPLYPWDAWTQWATKARVWFELRRMAPFVPFSEWLAAPAGSVYVDAAPHYPATVPLTQTWSATLLGRWDDALVNLPWWLSGVAFAFALYGCLRQLRFGALAALAGTWLVLSLPILDTHVALAGYADLPMAAYLTLAALSWLRFVRTREWHELAMACVLSAACVTIKNPGIVWVVMLLPGIVTAWLPRRGRMLAAIAFAVAAAAALVLTETSVTILGYRLQLDYDMPWRGLFDAYLAYANWHLLFYGALAVTVLGWRRLLQPEVAPLTIIVAFGIAFLLFGFAFTNARLWVEDQSTVNRATLHLAPLIVVWTMVAFRAWAEGIRNRDAAPEGVPLRESPISPS